MRSIKAVIAGLAIAMLCCTGVYAGTDLNEVGALLVFPTILAVSVDNPRLPDSMRAVETFVTITNAGPDDVIAHISYINGDWEDEVRYCYECDFQIPLTGNDTETLVVTYRDGGTHIVAEDLYLDLACPWPYGMLVVALEDEDGQAVTDNVLLGEEVIVNYRGGNAVSIPAIPPQGGPAWFRASVPAAGRLLGDRLRRPRESLLGFLPVRLLGPVGSLRHQPRVLPSEPGPVQQRPAPPDQRHARLVAVELSRGQ